MTFTCAICGTEKKTFPSRRSRKYCSRACAAIANSQRMTGIQKSDQHKAHISAAVTRRFLSPDEREAMRQRTRSWWQRHPDAQRANPTPHWLKSPPNIEKRRAALRLRNDQWWAAKGMPPATSARDRDIRHRYGITEAQYDQLLAQQDNCCAICRRDLLTTRKPAIDHDHVTLTVRGILCNPCNIHLGWLEEHGEQARAYLAANVQREAENTA